MRLSFTSSFRKVEHAVIYREKTSDNSRRILQTPRFEKQRLYPHGILSVFFRRNTRGAYAVLLSAVHVI